MTTRELLKNELVQLLQKRQPKHQDLTDSDRQTISFYIRFIVFKNFDLRTTSRMQIF